MIAKVTYGASCRWVSSHTRARICWNDSGTCLNQFIWLHRSIHCSSLWAALGRWQSNNSIGCSRSSSVIPADSEAIHTAPIQHSNLSHSSASMSDLAIFRTSMSLNRSTSCSETASSTSNSQYQWDKRWIPSEDRIKSKRSDFHQYLSSTSSTVTWR